MATPKIPPDLPAVNRYRRYVRGPHEQFCLVFAQVAGFDPTPDEIFAPRMRDRTVTHGDFLELLHAPLR